MPVFITFTDVPYGGLVSVPPRSFWSFIVRATDFLE